MLYVHKGIICIHSPGRVGCGNVLHPPFSVLFKLSRWQYSVQKPLRLLRGHLLAAKSHGSRPWAEIVIVFPSSSLKKAVLICRDRAVKLNQRERLHAWHSKRIPLKRKAKRHCYCCTEKAVNAPLRC